MVEYVNKPIPPGYRAIASVELWRRNWCSPKKDYKGPNSLEAQIVTNTASKNNIAAADNSKGDTTNGGGSSSESSGCKGPCLTTQSKTESIAEIALYKYLNDCPIESKWYLTGLTELNFSKSITEPTGTGTITFIYDKERFKRIRQGDELKISLGWLKAGNVDVKTVIKGFVAEVKKTTDLQISVEFCDAGVLLERECTETYQNKKRSEIIKDLIRKAGLKADVKLEGIPDDVISFSPQTSSGGSDSGTSSADLPDGVGPGKASGPFKKSCGSPSCPLSLSQYTTCTAMGKCVCGSDKIVYNRCPPGCGANKCAGLGPGNTTQGGANQFPEGSFFCCGCDRDFCGCGVVHDGSLRRILKTSCSSGSSSQAADGTGSGDNQKNEKMTYWDAINKVLEDYEQDTHVFVWYDTCYVWTIPGPDDAKSRLAAWAGYNLIDQTLEITEGKGPVISALKIVYGDEKKGQHLMIYDQDWDKYGDMGVVKLSYPNLKLSEAKEKGERILRQLQRENNETVTLETIGDPEFYVGRWVDVKSQYHDYEKTVYIQKFDIKVDPENSYQNSLECTLWKPPIGGGKGEEGGEQKGAAKSSGGGGGGVTKYGKGQLNGLSGYDGLNRLAKYICKNLNHCYGCGITADVVERTGRGDCWGLSDWSACVLRDNGYKVRVVQGATSEASNHRWCEVWLDGKWFPFDPSAATPKYGCHGPGYTWTKPYTVIKNYF